MGFCADHPSSHTLLDMQMEWLLFFVAAVASVASIQAAAPYYGTEIGPFKNHAHDVEGIVYAVDDRTIYIKDFSYDGQGPDAYFWGGSTSKPDATGFIIPDEKGKKTPLLEYRHKDILLRLPTGKTLRNIKWISVWCRKFNANFGEIKVPSNLKIPQPVEIGPIPTKDHGVSSGPVMVVDTQTLLVPEFTYDGLGPAAYWWVSRGARQHPRGLRLANEDGSLAPLAKYTGRTVVITLPDEHTVHDFDWFGVWCEEARVDFGSIAIPHDIVVPPSPRTLGIELEYKLNCEVLRDDLGYELRWIMDGEDIVMQLVARLEPGEYMSFGLSKNDSKSEMEKADAIVAWIDKKRKGHAVDYYLETKEQCVGRRGSCPDTKFPDGQNSVTLLNAAEVNGYTMITVKRPQVGLDEKYDQHVYSDGPQAIVWAIGPLNEKGEVSYHGGMRSDGDVYIDFARSPQWNCPQPLEPDTEPPPPPPTTTTTTTRKPTKRPDRKPTTQSSRRKPQTTSSRYTSRTASSDIRLSESKYDGAWHVPPVVCPTDRTFRAQIGPSGGKKGFQAITGLVGWGIAWYINGVLVPELTVERGKTYTFIVEGGDDPENPARTHPLYITDDPEGGYEYKTHAEKQRVKIYGGVSKDRRGKYTPTAKGRLCEFKLPQDSSAEDFETFEDFQDSLELRCARGKQGRLTFKPDKNTPDLLYYQCYTHRHLGWKINVVDSCQDTLRHEASVPHVRNITYNSFESDYKRGGEKKKLPTDIKTSWKDTVSKSVEDTSVLTPTYVIVKTTSQVPSQDDLYFRPTTSATKERTQYFFTTPEQKSLYKIKTTRAPPPPQKVVTMESFNLGDVVHSPVNRGHYYYSGAQVSSSSAPKQTAEALRVKVYQTPQSSSAAKQFDFKMKPQHRKQQSSSEEYRQRAVDALRAQLSVIQNNQHEPSVKEEVRSYHPHPQRNQGFSNHNRNSSSRQQPNHQSRGQSLAQVVALATSSRNSQNVVPVILQSSTGRSRHQNRNDRKSTSRRPSNAQYVPNKPGQHNEQSYFPLIIPRDSLNLSSSRNIPLVPVVLDQKQGNNLQTLHQVLSLLNKNPQSVKIVNLDRPSYHNRARRTRSADHHENHEHHGHEHEDHDHMHEGHDMHHKNPDQKSNAHSISLPLQTISIMCTIHIFKYLSRVMA